MKEKLPNGWIIVTIEEITEILDNLRKPVNSEERATREGNVPYYGATGQVGWIDDYLYDEELVLLGEDGAPFFDKLKNVAYLINGKSWVNNHAHVLKAKEGITINKFLLYFFNQLDYKDYVNGTTRLKLTQSSLKNIRVPLPFLPEQNRIVQKLDLLMAQIESCKAQLEKVPDLLKAFRQSVLNAAVTGKLTEDWREENGDYSWDNMTFEEIIKYGPQNGMYKPQSYYGEGTLILRIDNFYDGKINDWDTLRRLKVSKKELESYKLFNGEVIINRVNSINYLGKCGLVKDLMEDCVFESNMMRIRLSNNAVPEFVIIFLNSTDGITELRKNAKHAVNQASINQEDVKSILLPIPKPEEQIEIVKRVSLLFELADAIERKYHHAKAQVDALPQTILAKAFRGELVSQDINDESADVLLKRIKEMKERFDGIVKKVKLKEVAG